MIFLVESEMSHSARSIRNSPCALGQNDSQLNLFVAHPFGHLRSLQERNLENIAPITAFRSPQEIAK